MISFEHICIVLIWIWAQVIHLRSTSPYTLFEIIIKLHNIHGYNEIFHGICIILRIVTRFGFNGVHLFIKIIRTFSLQTKLLYILTTQYTLILLFIKNDQVNNKLSLIKAVVSLINSSS